ncbi:MAG: VWA domain-containing protein [Cytophagales bacterium]|nr:MAG: VWA domain-containing protein [Cytophagales bacterium]TAF60421.1 MAG: VWA domain-containing protein [Cytophagales bacterium]
MPEWLSLNWFWPWQIAAYTWGNPWVLWLLALLPLFLFLRRFLLRKKRQLFEVALSLKTFQKDRRVWLRHVLKLLWAMAYTLFVIALARPQQNNERLERWTEGIDIIIALDISESMQIQDFKPNRLEVAKKVAINFISGRFQDRIGLVLFAGDAFAPLPPTTDYDMLKSYIADLSFDLIPKGGTAIGSALAVATSRMMDSKSKSKVVLLISDGENTAGNIDPETASGLASAEGIKVYTIAVGRDGQVPVGVDAFGRTQYAENTLNETTLREIANVCDGEFFRATNATALQNIFEKINSYEKSEIKENRYVDTKDFYHIYLIWGLFFFLLWLAAKSSFMANTLED